MNKKLAGVCFVRNAVKLDYCIEASINSMKAFCDNVIVAYVDSEDDTLGLLKKIGGITLLKCSQQSWEEQKGKQKLSYFQNVAIEYAQEEGYEYIFLCQADECVHEDSIPYIKQAMALGENAYFVSRHNLWGSVDTMLNVPQSRKPCSSVVNRLAKSKYFSYDDGESLATEGASLDFINLIQIFHMGFVRDKAKHIAKIKEIQGNIFLWDYDKRADLKPEFDWKDWGFTEEDLIPIPKPLPKYLNEWVANLNKSNVMENYVLLKEDGSVNFTKVNDKPTFVNHPKVIASWIHGGMALGMENPINFAEFLFTDESREHFEWGDMKDIIDKTNKLLANK